MEAIRKRSEALGVPLKVYGEDFCAENIFLTNNECAFEISQALFHISAELYSGDGDITEECRAARLLVEAYVRSCEPTLDNIF